MHAQSLALVRRGAPRLVSTNFDFSHKIFRMAGAVFRRDVNGTSMFEAELGDVRCALRIDTIAGEFGIAEDSPDGVLLATVDKGLRYVKEIRPGDSIPREILDGSCSWRIEDRHHVLARQRITVQLASWITGGEAVISDATRLAQLADDPAIKAKVKSAVDEAAEKIGIGRERRTEVLGRIETVSRELAYIEALRERFGIVLGVIAKIDAAAQIYSRDRSLLQEIGRIQALLKKPVEEFSNDFDMVDAQTGEVISLLKKIDSQILFIREFRDFLHFKLMQWDEPIALWDGAPVSRGEELERALRKTYQFAARNFPLVSNWQLQAGGRPLPL